MSARIVWFPIVCLAVTAGCQAPGTGLFSWSRGQQLTSLSEDERADLADALKPNPDEQAISDRQASETTERENRIERWIRRGQQAIRKAEQSPQRDVLLTDAIQAFREVLKVDPDNGQAFHGMAIIADLSQDWSMAEYNYKRALSARQQDANLLNDLGYSYLLQERYHEATQYLNRAVQVDPRHEKSHVNLAILDIRRGDDAAALAGLSRLYPSAQAQATLASLVAEQRPDSPTSQPESIAQQREGASPAPATGPGDVRPVSAADVRPSPNHQTQRSQYSQPIPQSVQGHRQDTASQTASVLPQAFQGPLFDANGLIQVRRGGPAPATVDPASPNPYTQMVTPATLSRSVSALSTDQGRHETSALNGARAAGGAMTLRASHQTSLPSPGLPQSNEVQVQANGAPVAPYYHQAASFEQTGPYQNSARQGYHQSPATLAGSNQSSAMLIPQQQQPGSGVPQHYAGHGPPIPIWSEYLNGTHSPAAAVPGYQYPGFNHPAGAGALGGPGNPGRGYPTSVPGQVPFSGHNQQTGPGYTIPGQQPVSSGGFSPGYGGPGSGIPTVPVTPGFSGQLMGYAPGNSMSNDPFPGQGALPPASYTMQPGHSSAAGVPTQGTPPLGPLQVYPPPVMGPGFRAGGVTAPDPLEEYRARQRQLESQYNRTLQQVNGYQGDSSFQ